MGIDAGLVTEWRRGRRAAGLVELAVCRRLRALAAGVPADQAIVELGAFKGRATGWLLLGAQEGHRAHVTSVDPWGLRKDGYSSMSPTYTAPATYAAFKGHLARIGATKDTHTVKRGYAASVGAKWSGPPIGLLFHDADHSAEAVAADLAAWLPHLAEDAVVVLHDACDPNHGVQAGVEQVLDAGQWPERELIRWNRRPHRRGALIVKRAVADAGDGGGAVLAESDDDPDRGGLDPGADAPGPDVPGGQ
ncbi:putative O-methyltransferase YrrM [Lipingzhangella halophila]|uniref:Putative O-methyltransferase YrrM n=1 Tax=Lipingzhangella halophila TaxID=1783352 RepID=A0A7W7W783_9ACTN|nr:class I SAM-dependent methyltransferase [Lipingzhangella halophila]MBB4935655.1 putative O-methyltransferase YrrM [Lipingzhangella halophila]